MEPKEQSVEHRNKIIMVALFPPPYSSGERILNQMNKEILSEKFDIITFNVSTGVLNPASVNLLKIKNQIHTVYLYFKALISIQKIIQKEKIHGLYMVTPGSVFGHIRDAIIFTLVAPKVKTKIAFIQNGHIDKVFQKKWYSYFTKKLIAHVTCFVFTSQGLKEKVRAIPENKNQILYNSIDTTLIFSEEELKNKRLLYHTNNHKLRILYLSNMTPSKGYMDVAKAALSLHKKGIITIVDFVGEWLSDEHLTEFQKFVIQNDLTHIIQIHGKVNDRYRIKKFYKEADFFILPTYFSHEAQPVSIVEALNAGIPVISTYHASIPEMITDGYNGILVSKKQPEAIVAAIEACMHPDVWMQMSINARHSYEIKFSRIAYEKKLLELFI